VYVLFLVGVLSTLSAAVLGESVYIVRQAEHDKASRYAQLAAEQSTALYLLQARALVGRSGVSAFAGTSGAQAWTTQGSSCYASVADCAFTYSATVSLASVSGASSVGQAPNDQAVNMQQSYMGEQRAAVRLEVAVVGKSGNVVARRVRLLTLRVFNADPWVIISGRKEEVAHTSEAGDAQGDTGGLAAQPGDLPAPDPRYPDAYRDTRVHITVLCVNDVAGGNEGSGGVQVSCLSAPSPAPVDAFAASPTPWHNGDVANPGGWSE
jgi:hypothetical protein